MKRILFNFAAAISLLILAVSLVQWYRGYGMQDAWFIRRAVGTPDDLTSQYIGLTSCRGALWFGIQSSWTYEPDSEDRRAEWRSQLGKGWRMYFNVYTKPIDPGFKTGDIHAFGFHFSRDIHRASPLEGHRALNVVVPTWFVALGASILPMIWLSNKRSRLRRSRRIAAGLCADCGYDLRATPGQCPECGAGSVAL